MCVVTAARLLEIMASRESDTLPRLWRIVYVGVPDTELICIKETVRAHITWVRNRSIAHVDIVQIFARIKSVLDLDVLFAN